MYARMTVAHVQPEHFDDAVAAVQEGFFPAAQAQPGYSGFLVLTNRTMNQLVGISLWESETDMERSRGTGGYFQQRMDDFAEFVTEPPAITTHEVAVREP